MPSAALAYPDALAVTITYLRAALVGAARPVRVTSQIPNPRPVELVKLTRTGGPEIWPVLDAAQITVDCWAATDSAAWDIAALARRLLADMRGTVQSGVSIHRVTEFGGPQDLPDPVSNTPRVSFTLQIQLRGRAA